MSKPISTADLKQVQAWANMPLAQKTVDLQKGDTVCATNTDGDKFCVTPADPGKTLARLATRDGDNADQNAAPTHVSLLVPLDEFHDAIQQLKVIDTSKKIDKDQDAGNIGRITKQMQSAFGELKAAFPTLGEIQDKQNSPLVRDWGRAQAGKAAVAIGQQFAKVQDSLNKLQQLGADLKSGKVKAGSDQDTRVKLFQDFYNTLGPIFTKDAPEMVKYLEDEHPLVNGVRQGLNVKFAQFCADIDNAQAKLSSKDIQDKIASCEFKPRPVWKTVLIWAGIIASCVFFIVAFVDQKLFGDKTLFGDVCGGYLSLAKTLVDADFFKKEMDSEHATTFASILGTVVGASSGMSGVSSGSGKSA